MMRRQMLGTGLAEADAEMSGGWLQHEARDGAHPEMRVKRHDISFEAVEW